MRVHASSTISRIGWHVNTDGAWGLSPDLALTNTRTQLQELIRDSRISLALCSPAQDAQPPPPKLCLQCSHVPRFGRHHEAQSAPDAVRPECCCVHPFSHISLPRIIALVLSTPSLSLPLPPLVTGHIPKLEAMWFRVYEHCRHVLGYLFGVPA